MKSILLAYIRSTWELSNGTYWKAEDIKGSLLTDLNLSFAHIDSEGKVQLNNKMHISQQVAKLQKAYPDLRINLSIGGWGAEGFSEAASTEEKRRIFAESTLMLVRELCLNGADIDWEFPVGPDWGQKIKSSPKDRENYILLLSALRETFDKEEKLTGRHLSLSAAIPSCSWFIEKNDVRAAAGICDYLNLMCYDYYGSWSRTTGFNASLFASPNDPAGWNTDKCVKLYSAKGIPAEKIVLGLPTYGFAWQGVADNGSHGLFQTGKQFLGNFDYAQLESKYTEGFEDFFDEASKQSYRYNARNQIFATYPSEDFIKAAAAYAETSGLAGIMYWEYGHDMDASLLTTMNQHTSPQSDEVCCS